MQTQQGIALDRYLKEKGPLAPAQAVKVAIQAAVQLTPAIGSFLVHPGRIQITPAGSVRLLPPAAEELALPPVVEFPAYASPEEIRGGKPDVRSGLYSLGCVLFELLTGSPPYTGKDPKAILQAHLHSPVPEPGVGGSALEATVLELLAKDPAARIQTPEELVRRLKLVLSGAASAPTTPAPAAKALSGTRAPGRSSPAPAVSGRQPPAAASPHHPAPGRQPVPPRRSAGIRRPVAARVAGGRGHAGSSGARRKGPRDPLGAHGGLPEEAYEEEAPRPAEPKRSHSFTIAGAVIGLLLGGLVALKVATTEKEKPSQEATLEELSAKTLRERKERFSKLDADLKKEVEKGLAVARTRPPKDRREFYATMLDKHAKTRWGYLVANALAELGKPEAEKISDAEGKAIDEEYAQLKAAAERLAQEGKLAKAIEKVRENEVRFKERHGRETDEAINKWSAELTRMWDGDKKAVEKHGLAGEPEKAVQILEKALVYGEGDQPIQREARELLDGYQQQVQLSADNKATVERMRDERLEGAGEEKKEEAPAADDEDSAFDDPEAKK